MSKLELLKFLSAQKPYSKGTEQLIHISSQAFASIKEKSGMLLRTVSLSEGSLAFLNYT